jgi:hypothetical protein
MSVDWSGGDYAVRQITSEILLISTVILHFLYQGSTSPVVLETLLRIVWCSLN